MYEFIESKKEIAFENHNENEEFWKIYKFYHNGYCPRNTKISKKFLDANKDLLK